MRLDEIFPRGGDFGPLTTDVAWSCRTSAPELLEALRQAEPELPSLVDELHRRLPVQRHWQFGDFGPYVRPDKHVRALYLRLGRVLDGSSGGVVAIKGAEPLADNFDDIVQRLVRDRVTYTWALGTMDHNYFKDYGIFTHLERFPIAEGKPPGVHPLWDAQEEADCALAFQVRHLRVFGALARVPVPLLVCRFASEVTERAWRLLQPHMAAKTSRLVESEIRDGLGAYVYYYPTLPARIMHMPVADSGTTVSYDGRMKRLRELCDPEQTVERWLDMTARLLFLGYVATDPCNLNRGYCIQPQNMTIDGGMVDTNSIRSVDTFTSAAEVRFAVMRTVQSLAQSIAWFLVGSQAGVDLFLERIPDAYRIAWNEMGRRFAELTGPDRQAHPTTAGLLSSKGGFADFDAALGEVLREVDYRPERKERDEFRK